MTAKPVLATTEAAKALARTVAGRRRSCGLSQPQLAEKSGLSRSVIANIEAGRNELSLAQTLALAQAFGVSLGELCGEAASLCGEAASRVADSVAAYTKMAEECWRIHDYLQAIRYRGVAEGLGIALSHLRGGEVA